MIKHIVMWKLREQEADDVKEETAIRIKQVLEDLQGVVPTLRTLEVGININLSEAADDVVLVTTFESAADLDAYQVHPAHQAAAAVIRNLVSSRRVVDFETGL
ncbi:MAG: Dabb family protein [Anaerolineales bacterium]|nr:Dabb family protein [Anaerolineales bacterium]